MTKLALKLVEKSPFYTEEGRFWSSNDRDAHTLHFSISYPESFRPQLASYFIKKYSARGDVVLDPFCGRGTTPLEASLLGRIAYASDVNPLSVQVSRAKLAPADLVETAMYLQAINFSRPVSLEYYNKYFEPFYDPDTYRELVNLKSHIAQKPGRVSGFVELIALSLLHGHTAGYFSAYSLPQISVSSKYQQGINDRRGKLPEYRAVAPRILRKAGSILRDGEFHLLHENAESHVVAESDCRNLNFIANNSVDLVLTAPPRPFAKNFITDLWLKMWFAGVSREERESLYDAIHASSDIASWKEFMNESLLELARVVKSSGRAVFDLKSVSDGKSEFYLDQELIELVENELSVFWDVESVLIHRSKSSNLDNRMKSADNSKKTNRVVILRRK